MSRSEPEGAPQGGYLAHSQIYVLSTLEWGNVGGEVAHSKIYVRSTLEWGNVGGGDGRRGGYSPGQNRKGVPQREATTGGVGPTGDPHGTHTDKQRNRGDSELETWCFSARRRPARRSTQSGSCEEKRKYEAHGQPRAVPVAATRGSPSKGLINYIHIYTCTYTYIYMYINIYIDTDMYKSKGTGAIRSWETWCFSARRWPARRSTQSGSCEEKWAPCRVGYE